jgi:hypothetical protein
MVQFSFVKVLVALVHFLRAMHPRSYSISNCASHLPPTAKFSLQESSDMK